MFQWSNDYRWIWLKLSVFIRYRSLVMFEEQPCICVWFMTVWATVTSCCIHYALMCFFFLCVQSGLGGWQIGLLYLQLGQTFNGLEWPQDSEDPEGLDGVDVLAFCPSVHSESTISLGDVVQPIIMKKPLIPSPSNKSWLQYVKHTLCKRSCCYSVSGEHACGCAMLFYRDSCVTGFICDAPTVHECVIFMRPFLPHWHR